MNSTRTISDKLAATWRKERLYFVLRALSIFLPCAGVLMAVDLLVDWLFYLPGVARGILLFVNIGILGWILGRYGRGMFVRYSPDRTALQVERRYPVLKSILVSCVQFAGHAPDPGVSRELRSLVCAQAAEQTADMDFEDIVRLGSLRRMLAVSAIVVLFWAGFGIVKTPFLHAFACRMLNPYSTMDYPTRTIIEFVTGDIVVQEGAAFDLEARAGGVIPEAGRLYVQSEQTGWERLALTRRKGARFRYTCEEAARDFSYYFRLGDARSQIFRVAVIPSPRIIKARVRLTPPAYTGTPARNVENLTLQTPEGTRIEWTLRLDRAVSGALLTIEGADARAMECDPDGRIVRASAVAVASHAYHFRWTEREHGYTYVGPRNFIQVIPDKPPRIELLHPTTDEKGTTKKRLFLSYRARDDHGLSNAVLVTMLNEGKEKRFDLKPCKGRKTLERMARLELAEIVPGLKEGNIVTYAIEVRDDYPGEAGPHTVRSESRRVQILSERNYLAYLDRRRKTYLGALRPLYRQERTAHEAVNALRTRGQEK